VPGTADKADDVCREAVGTDEDGNVYIAVFVDNRVEKSAPG